MAHLLADACVYDQTWIHALESACLSASPCICVFVHPSLWAHTVCLCLFAPRRFVCMVIRVSYFCDAFFVFLNGDPVYQAATCMIQRSIRAMVGLCSYVTQDEGEQLLVDDVDHTWIQK